jgi:hypothetical protein
VNVPGLRTRILEAVGASARTLGLHPCRDGGYCTESRGITRLLTVSFLDRRHAAYFGTCTASFSLEVGVWFSDPRTTESASEPSTPRHLECQIRHLLVRDLLQSPPSLDLPAPDGSRRDIWWLSRIGDNLGDVAASASKAVAQQAPPFFARFSNPGRAYRYFKLWPVTRWLRSAPFNVGVPNSPSHSALLRLLREHLDRAD